MAPPQQIKHGKKLNATDSEQKVKTKRKVKVAGAPRKPKTMEDVKPISKYKEWKLLYTPYPFKSVEDNSSPKKGSRAGFKAEEQDSTKHEGLCRSCKKQKTCKLPKPEGGVWRCEDYE